MPGLDPPAPPLPGVIVVDGSTVRVEVLSDTMPMLGPPPPPAAVTSPAAIASGAAPAAVGAVVLLARTTVKVPGACYDQVVATGSAASSELTGPAIAAFPTAAGDNARRVRKRDRRVPHVDAERAATRGADGLPGVHAGVSLDPTDAQQFGISGPADIRLYRAADSARGSDPGKPDIYEVVCAAPIDDPNGTFTGCDVIVGSFGVS